MRVRVEQEIFSDDEPGPPEASEGVALVKERSKAPYSITVSSLSFVLRTFNSPLNNNFGWMLVLHCRTGTWKIRVVAG